MRKIVGGVVRYRDLVAKIKIAKLFSWRVGDSRKFVLAKISRYTVTASDDSCVRGGQHGYEAMGHAREKPNLPICAV